jgi:hypothetical protein
MPWRVVGRILNVTEMGVKLEAELARGSLGAFGDENGRRDSAHGSGVDGTVG